MTAGVNGAPPILVASLLREEGETGVQTHFCAFARFLASEGRAVEIVTPYGPDAWFFYPLYALRFPLQRLNASLGVWWYRATRRLALGWRLWWRLRRGQPATVYAQCPVSAAAGLAVRAHPGQAVALVVHFNVSQADEFVGQGLLREGDWVWRGIRRLEAEVLPRLDGIVFVSRFMRQQLLARIPQIAGVPHDEIPNFVAAGARQATPQGPRRRLIAIGTLEPRKNQRHLLRAFAAASALLPGLELTLAGDGPDRPALQALAADLGVAKQTHFLGHVSGAARLLPDHDACIHTARLENLPIALIEAMSCGLPVLACPVGGIPELFNDGVEGRYLPLDDAEAAGSIIAETLGDAATANHMAAAAAARFASSFELASVARRLMGFLDRLASARAARA